MFLVFNSNAAIDKTKYYTSLESNSLEKIESQIISLKKEKASQDKNAYLGAMIMKKSHHMRTPKEKIALFKEGKLMLERAIKKYPNNPVYRFLRLVIQENCPKFLKYNSQIQSDVKFIKLKFHSMDTITMKFVKSYSKTSKGLIL